MCIIIFLHSITEYSECKLLYIMKFKQVLITFYFHQFIHVKFSEVKKGIQDRGYKFYLPDDIVHVYYKRHEICYHFLIYTPAVFDKLCKFRIRILFRCHKSVKCIVYLSAFRILCHSLIFRSQRVCIQFFYVKKIHR